MRSESLWLLNAEKEKQADDSVISVTSCVCAACYTIIAFMVKSYIHYRCLDGSERMDIK